MENTNLFYKSKPQKRLLAVTNETRQDRGGDFEVQVCECRACYLLPFDPG
jgi:hypothetical protein